MRITTFTGERNLGDLTARVFPNLATGQMQAARDALVNANPALQTIDTMQVGSVLLVPDLPVAGAAGGPGKQAPAAAIVQAAAAAVAAYRTRLRAAIESEMREIGTASAELGSDPVRQILTAFSLDQQVITSVQEALAARLQAVQDLKLFDEVTVTRIATDLEVLTAKLD